MTRLNAFTAAAEGYAALANVEAYLAKCGLEHRLLALVNTRVSQINGCAHAPAGGARGRRAALVGR